MLRCHESEKQSLGFYLRRGIRLSDLADLRKLCLTLCINLKTGLDFFYGLSLFDLIDLCSDLQEVTKELNGK